MCLERRHRDPDAELAFGLVGSSATQPLIDNLGKVAPDPAKEIFTSVIQNLQKSQAFYS